MIALSIFPIIMGALIGAQTAINSKLRQYVGSPFFASAISFTVGAIFLCLLTLGSGGFNLTAATFTNNPWWIWLGGLLGMLALTTNILLFSRLGSVQTAVLPIFGQIAMSLLIDEFGWFNSPVNAVTFVRGGGFLLVIIGVLLAVIQRNAGATRSETKNLFGWQVLGVLTGMLIAIQTAINGHLGVVLGSSTEAAEVSFTIGAVILWLVCLTLRTPFSQISTAVAAGGRYWWIWLGGILGSLYVFGAAWLVPQIGTGQVVVMALFGQLVSSALIEQFGWLEARRAAISRAKAIGLLVMFVGVVITKLM